MSGYRAPSSRNAEAFEAAVRDIAATSQRLLESFGVEVEDGPNRWVTRAGEHHEEHVHPLPLRS